jgi:hypothetical protein
VTIQYTIKKQDLFFEGYCMVGPRTHIALLTLFFTFAFTMLFIALMQNYAHAGTLSLQSLGVITTVHPMDIQSAVDTQLVPTF